MGSKNAYFWSYESLNKNWEAAQKIQFPKKRVFFWLIFSNLDTQSVPMVWLYQLPTNKNMFFRYFSENRTFKLFLVLYSGFFRSPCKKISYDFLKKLKNIYRVSPRNFLNYRLPLNNSIFPCFSVIFQRKKLSFAVFSVFLATL